jgi:hypothetical protein
MQIIYEKYIKVYLIFPQGSNNFPSYLNCSHLNFAKKLIFKICTELAELDLGPDSNADRN